MPKPNQELILIEDDIVDTPWIIDSRNLPVFKHELLKKISLSAKENQCFADDAYRVNGELDIGLAQFEPLAHFLNKPWKEDRFLDLEPDWMYIGNKRWDLLLGGAPEKLFKKLPPSEQGQFAADPEPTLRKARIYVTIEGGLVPDHTPWALSFVSKNEIPRHEDLPDNIMGKPGRRCATM